MAKYNAHERALIRRLEEQNALLEKKNKKLDKQLEKLEEIKDVLVMMLTKQQFKEYTEMLDATEGA